MPPLPLVRRVEILEENVNALNQLPDRVSAIEVQLLALREDVTSLRGEFTSFRAEMRGELTGIHDEIRAGDEETRRQMRILHEEVISRFALLQEGASNGKARRSRGRDRSRPR